MSAVVELEWTFSPPDYFEEPIEISRHDYAMTIANGKAQAKIDCGVYDADPSMRQRLDDGLNDRFLGVQLLTLRAFVQFWTWGEDATLCCALPRSF